MAVLSVPLRGAEVERVFLWIFVSEADQLRAGSRSQLRRGIQGKTTASGCFQGLNLSSRVAVDPAKHLSRRRENATFFLHGSRESLHVLPTFEGSCDGCLRAVRLDGC